MPQILNEIVEVVKAVKNVPQERISEGFDVQIVDAPVSHSQPQILNEVVEVVKVVKNHPQERISGKIDEQIDDDTVPVDQPGDQVRRDRQACGVATTGPSVSDCGEGGGSPAGSAHRQNYGRASDHADAATFLPSDSRIVVKTTKVLPVPFIGRYVDVPVIKQLVM